jgi:hypothetical protein
MTDQADRERESRESELTKFDEQRLEDDAERDAAAGNLQDEPQPAEDET